MNELQCIYFAGYIYAAISVIMLSFPLLLLLALAVRVLALC